VDGERSSGLAAVYRWGRGTAFVSTDAILAAYDLLLRRLLNGLAETRGREVEAALGAWAKNARSAPAGESGRIARFYTTVLQWLGDAPPDDAPPDVAEAVERQVARLLDDAEPTGVAEVLGTGLDERSFPACTASAGSPGEAWEGVIRWLTRAALPDTPGGREARRFLAASIPEAVRDAVLGDVAFLGMARAVFPGPEGESLIELRDVDDKRFPPATLPGGAEAVGLELGAHLGSALAREKLAEIGLMEELSRPKCASNSQRRLKDKKTPAAASAEE
jgi:hypothetical protein